MTAFTLWLTGIPGSGKTTLARLLARELRARGVGSQLLDGEELRKETPGLGFTLEERQFHILRAAVRAQPVLASGRVALMAFVSPHRSLRALARRKSEVLGPFVEVWTRCSSETARARKPNLYRRVSEAVFYEPGEPELVLDTDREGADISAHRLVRALEARGLLEPPLAVREVARPALVAGHTSRVGPRSVLARAYKIQRSDMASDSPCLTTLGRGGWACGRGERGGAPLPPATVNDATYVYPATGRASRTRAGVQE